jgi:hypothetical protein
MAILLIPALVFGQAQTTGRVTGKVVDEEGNPVAGARVTLISSALQGERIVKTADNGVFLAALLPVGPYAVEISAPGMQPISLSFRLGVGQTVPLDVVLKQGEQIVEEVTVYGTATPLETTSLGDNFDYAVGVEELPIQNRDIERVAEFAPNVSFGPTPNTLAISGAPSFDTVVLLDGAEVSDPYFGSAPTLYLEDAVEEVQVMTSGVSARYGRFQGGVINAITKTGGNTFDGMLRATYNKESWNSQTPFGEDQSDELNEVYQLTFGGYMLKDHLWFFLGARTLESAQDNSVQLSLPGGGAPSFTTNDAEDRWQFKLRGAITSDHVIELNYLNYERTRSNRAGLPAGNILAANGIRDDPREIYTGVYQGVLTPNLFLDLQATSKRVAILSGPDPARSDASPFFDFGIGAVFNNHWWDYNDPGNRDNDTIGLNLTQAISTSNWGSHTLEYGAQYVKSTTGGENVQSVTGLNMLPVPLGTTNFSVPTSNPETTLYNINSFVTGTGAADMYIYKWEALGLQGDQELENLGIYVQDTWEIDKWRFDIGLRYDAYDGSGPQTIQNFDFDEIAPRLGLTYNINQNWQVQATWGKYISRFNDGIFGNVTGVGAAPYVQSVYTGPEYLLADAATMERVLRNDPAECGGETNASCWNLVTFVNDTQQPVQFLGDGVTAPYANDFNFSVRYALPRNSGSLVFALTDRKFKNLLDDFVGGVEGPNGLFFRDVVDPLPPDPNDPASFPFDWVKWDNASQAERQYQAFTVIADYRPSANWGIGGNYTYSQTQGNYEGEGRNQPAIGTAIGTYVASRPTEAAVPFGTLNSDIPHRLRFWGNYRWNFDRAGQFVLGAIYTYQSGFVWSQSANVSYSDTPEYINDQGTYTHYYFGRGNQRFQGFWAADLSARYQFPIWKRLQGWVKVDMINFTNEGTLTSFNTSGSTDNSGGVPQWAPGGAFGRIESELDYQTPRQYLLTLGLTF